MKQALIIFITVGLLASCENKPTENERISTKEIELKAGEIAIRTLPVGSGNCQVLQCPPINKNVLFDCGTRGKGDLGWTSDQVKEYFSTISDANTNWVVSVSHPDIDHYRYIPKIFDQAIATEILIGADREYYSEDMQEWMDAQESNGSVITEWIAEYWSTQPEPALSCQDGNGNGVQSYILTVNAGLDDYPDDLMSLDEELFDSATNGGSMVVASIYHTFQTIFTGDMTRVTEDAINENLEYVPVDLEDTDFITGAHHGSTTHGSNSAEWAEDNSAGVIVYSSGTIDTHPWCDGISNYEDYLFDSDLHRYECGDEDREWVYEDTRDATYVTNNNGQLDVVVPSDGNFYWRAQYRGF